MKHLPALALLFLAANLNASFAQSAAATHDTPMADVEEQKEGDWTDGRWQKTDVGQFLSGTIATPGKPTYKGIAIKLGEHTEATICFDTDLLRVSAGWTGGFVKPDAARYGLIKPLAVSGEVVFTTPTMPGWSKDGNFADPRPRPFGPLPRDRAKYRGLYLSGSRVVLHYTVGEAEVWESPWCESHETTHTITRTLEISPAEAPMELLVCDVPGAVPEIVIVGGGRFSILRNGDSVTAIGVKGHNSIQPRLTPEGRALLVIPSHQVTVRAKLFLWKGTASGLAEFAALVKPSPAPEDLTALTRGGPPRWDKPLVTRGQVDLAAGAFAIDTLTMPYQNPWNALMFAGGHGFFPNGDAAVCTVHGDVWRVSGIDVKLARLTWKRFATGLFQPLGLKIVNGKVHVLGRDQITVLEDLNNDGEADHYVNFNNDAEIDANGHGYATCLETDAAGNFYYLLCGSSTAHGGSLLRVSRDGAKLDVIATGFRNPNGLGVGPDDTLTVADQEGEWVPSTRLDVMKPGGFYGYMPMHHRTAKPETYDPPLCWMPKIADNSAGGQVWVTSDKWGVLQGQMLHLSYGHCSMLLVLRESVGGQIQGGVVPLPGRFLSGVMRGAFHPRDGHLYVTGLRGWQTSAVRDGCFQRVRCQPDKLQFPVALTAHTNGLRVTFNEPLDPKTAEEAGSYDAQRWNYRWTASYGSKDWSVANPEKQGRDTLTITSAKLSSDGRSVFLQIQDLRPVMQMQLRYNVNSGEGKTLRGEVYHTIHQLGAAGEASGASEQK